MSMPYLGYSEDILVGKVSAALKVERQKIKNQFER